MPPKNEDPQSIPDILTQECAHFISDGGFSAEDMREAYLILLEGEEKEGMTESVATLLAKMKEFEEKGLPLNRLARLVELKDDFELPKERYVDYVSSLPISQKEKDVLCSIVEKRRSGKIELYFNNQPSVAVVITVPTHATSDDVGRDLKRALGEALKDYSPDKKLGVTFEED